MERSDWGEEMTPVLGVWSSNSKASGGLCVMTTGPSMKPMWCADSWGVGEQWTSLPRPALGREEVQYGETLPAMALRRPSKTVPSEQLKLAVTTMKMQE